MAKHMEVSGPENRRSDARQTHARIVRAATELILSRRPVTMSGLARAASVSRPTLYDHFTCVEDVIEAAVERALSHAQRLLAEAAPPDGEPTEAMAHLLRTRWQSLAGHGELYRLAADSLPPGRLQKLHESSYGTMSRLIDRGKGDGSFRTDLPTEWLVAVVYGLLHQAADEVLAGRLPAAGAGEVVSTTVLSALRAP